MPVEVQKSAIDWKGALPVMVLLFVIAVLEMQGIFIGEGFIGLVVLGALIVLILPVLNSAGISAKHVNVWFVRAAAFLMIAAAFTMIPYLNETVTMIASTLTTIGVILAWLMLFIGSLVALANIKA